LQLIDQRPLLGGAHRHPSPDLGSGPEASGTVPLRVQCAHLGTGWRRSRSAHQLKFRRHGSIMAHPTRRRPWATAPQHWNPGRRRLSFPLTITSQA